MTGWIEFRPDVGSGTGLGHLRRCLSLAQALRNLGVNSVFAIQEGREIAAAAGFPTVVADPVRAIVIDSYSATPSDYSNAGTQGVKVIAIDDDGQRPLDVDLVINPGPGAEDLHYPGAKSRAVGVEFGLLRPEFADEPERIHPPVARRLLITMGGGDQQRLAAGLTRAARRSFDRIDVMVGPFFESVEEIQEIARGDRRVVLHSNPADVRALMLEADVAVTAGGQTLFELAATATPAVAIEVAPNQRRNLEGFCERGAIVVAGVGNDPDIIGKTLSLAVVLAGDQAQRNLMGANGRRWIDGRGAARAAERIVEQIGNTG
jgi:UDP-2,4-diacetamido-2,4,6-trideoxy-beta-L-altropyranose hydrolase